MPDGAEPMAILCLGAIPDFPPRPQLELDRWTLGRPLSEFVSGERLGGACTGIGWRSW